jgi:hypothetical protein
MSDKSIFLNPAFDAFALVLATCALVAATAALTRATRRSTRSKILVRAHAGYLDDDAFFVVDVINSGVGDVSVEAIRMLMPVWAYQAFHYPSPLPGAALKGPDLPYTLQGEHSAQWSIQPHAAIEFNNSHVRVVASPGTIKAMKRVAKRYGRYFRVRARVDLGNGKWSKSGVAIGLTGWLWIHRVHEEWLQLKAEHEEWLRLKAEEQKERDLGRKRKGTWERGKKT